MGPRDYESVAWVDGREALFAWFGTALAWAGHRLVRAGARIAAPPPALPSHGAGEAGARCSGSC